MDRYNVMPQYITLSHQSLLFCTFGGGGGPNPRNTRVKATARA